jgi:hypothetical protein
VKKFAFENAILPWTSMACRSIPPSCSREGANRPEIQFETEFALRTSTLSPFRLISSAPA